MTTRSSVRTVVAVILSLSITPMIFAQGTVLFNNTPSTLVYSPGQGLLSGAPQTWYFGLLTSPSGAPGTFAFTGNYATNAAVPGRFIGGTQIVNGWAPGTTMYYEVAGWHSSLGSKFNPGWLVAPPAGPFAISQIGWGIAGGDVMGIPYPPLPLFGGTGISSGFTFFFLPDLILVPDPRGGVRFGFSILGLGGIPAVIEASTNCQSWVVLQSSTTTGYFTYFSDPGWTNYSSRFYRIRSPGP